MYKSYVRPLLEYGSEAWCGINQFENDKLELLNKRAARIISGAICRARTELVFEELDWVSLQERRDHKVLILFHKMVHHKAPRYLVDLVPKTVGEQHDHNLRNANDFHPPDATTESYDNSFLSKAVRLWNEVDVNIRNNPDPLAFKNSLNKQILEHNPYLSYGTRKENIIMAKLRMNCSDLRGHLAVLNIIPNSTCRCGENIENTVHYFMTCPLYRNARTTLHNSIAPLTSFTVRKLLYGDSKLTCEQNELIFRSTISYINATSRFS